MTVKRVVVAGVTSGVGKTTISLGIIHALRRRGYKVQPFKVGPDFIDPSYHSLIAGRTSRNLDVWMMRERGVVDCFVRASQGADFALIEGVMGMFDGISGRDNFASTAHVAKILKSPVVLVVDAGKAARSVAAMILGFLSFDKRVKVSGIILNNVASERHALFLTEAIASKIKAPVIGVVRRDSGGKLEERHLGLVPANSLEGDARRRVIKTASEIGDQIKIDKLLEVSVSYSLPHAARAEKPSRHPARIAVALDESFNFYYQDNLDALRSLGARLEYFSPVSDDRLPDGINGIILGGGFPEVLADRLEKNRSMIRSIRKNIEQGTPAYAECGGLMYLTRSIRGYKGSEKKRKMAGIIDADTEMTGRLTLNYTEAECHGPFFGLSLLRGHEFHYSKIDHISGDCRFAYDLRMGNGIANGKDGIVFGDNGLAGYTHLHFAEKRLAAGIVNACSKYSRR